MSPAAESLAEAVDLLLAAYPEGCEYRAEAVDLAARLQDPDVRPLAAVRAVERVLAAAPAGRREVAACG